MQKSRFWSRWRAAFVVMGAWFPFTFGGCGNDGSSAASPPLPPARVSPIAAKVQELSKSAGITLPESRPGAVRIAPPADARYVVLAHVATDCPQAAEIHRCEVVPHWRWTVEGERLEVEGFQAWLYALRGTVSDWTKAPYLLLLCDERAPVYALYATVDLAAVAGLWNFTMVDAEGGLAGFYDIRDQRVRGPEVRDVGDMILGEMPEGLKDAELVALDTPVWRTDRKLQSQVLDSFAAGVTAKLEEARVKAGTGHSPKLVVQPNLTDRVAHLYVMLAACRGGGATTILDRNRVPSLPKSIPQDVQSFPKKE